MRRLTRLIDRLSRMPHQARAAEYGAVTPRPAPLAARLATPQAAPTPAAPATNRRDQP